ncbi:DUF1330 domain-containing protein [Aquidulcibacter sp.]|jgi:uncharacterized protein (DUF1330 family)|uniref:DUF1330 domain-containing protein n=1 Tax=Aquidulcibacter sp. TaxID=2052990 RepID=UPI003BA45335
MYLATLSAALWLALAQAPSSTPVTNPPAPTSQGGEGASCDKPVYLVIMVDQFDRTKARPYAEAMRASGIVRRNQGSYKISGAPTLVLEGQWPSDRGFVVEHYPCRAAFEAMWNSAEYQEKLKPLRANTGNYSIMLFNAVPEPRK